MNPLKNLHEQAEAEFQAYGDVEIVSTFGEPQAEYAAVRKGCALIDAAQRGVLEATGADRIDFLNRLLTNELVQKESKRPIAAGSGVYSFLLNNKGRVIADMNVIERGDKTLIETDARNIPGIEAILRKHIFSEKVDFSSCVQTHRVISLHGPRTREVLTKVLGEMPELKPLESDRARFDETDVMVWRDDPCGVPGYHLLLNNNLAGKLWIRFLTAAEGDVVGKRMVRPAGWAVFNTARIEAGRPLFGIDFDDSILPAETSQLERAVNFTKGCYLGQEIVARMHARNQVARKIVGIRMKEDALPIAGAPVTDGTQNQIGGITSSTISPVLSNASICLGLVKAAFAAVGSEVKVAAEGAFRDGVVVGLPFVN